ncbi:MAG: segregation/condensation protein A [Acidobacteriota bacterium]|jgi:segregation and condensation protein A|nr:segregation/condensation protein A [Acidobacteriota bacterium]
MAMDIADNTADMPPPVPPPSGEELTIRLEVFQGPLDLLLTMVKKEEIDVWSFPIARVTGQYLEYLRIMKDLNINVAGEWLLMAATLIYIKSRKLLPPDPSENTGEEIEDDPLRELVYDLLEHQKFKNAAETLYTREEVEKAVWANPPAEVLEEAEEVVSVTLFDLMRAFHDIVLRFEEQRTMEVVQEEVTVEQKIADIRRLFVVHDKILFSVFFAAIKSKQHLIATFLALLELVRLREVLVFQEKAFDEIQISKR